MSKGFLVIIPILDSVWGRNPVSHDYFPHPTTSCSEGLLECIVPEAESLPQLQDLHPLHCPKAKMSMRQQNTDKGHFVPFFWEGGTQHTNFQPTVVPLSISKMLQLQGIIGVIV